MSSWWLPLLLWPVAAQAQQVEVINFNTGTGAFVNKAGYVVTNYHVIKPCEKYQVYANQSSMQASLIAKDEAHDLALLKTTFSVPYSGVFRSTAMPLHRGEGLLVIGFPGKAWEKREPVLRKASLLSLKGPQKEEHLLQFSESVQQGNSGGPLLDKSGHMVGVVVAKSTTMRINTRTKETESIEHADIAISLPAVLAFLDTHQVPYQQADSLVQQSPQMIKEKGMGYIVNVRCVVQ